VQLRKDADERLQKVSGRSLILCSDHYVFSLRTSKKVRIFFVWTDIISSRLPSDRLSLFGRSVNCWRVSTLARTLQLFKDRPNNHSRSRELRTLDKIIPKNNDRYRAIYGNLENKINTLYWPVENSIHKNNDADDR
jgi:hypothetical protein